MIQKPVEQVEGEEEEKKNADVFMPEKSEEGEEYKKEPQSAVLVIIARNFGSKAVVVSLDWK